MILPVNINNCSDLGNPYHMQNRTDAERKRVIELYRKYAQKLSIDPLLGAIRLGCCCKPKECHGDVLVALLKERRVTR
jgi:hypothetical protein